MSTLRVGERAFFDCFAGLVACKVLAISGPSGPASSKHVVRFEITRAHGPYRAGEVLERSALWVIPVEAVSRGNYGASILPYRVETQ
jgi:hypothetical protein